MPGREKRLRKQRLRARRIPRHANTGTAADTAAPFGDGVPNLLKYAFNLDPSGFDKRVLVQAD